MAQMFSKPKFPKPEAQSPAPTVDDARQRVDMASRDRKRKGRASTQMVSEESGVSTAARTLTGT